MIRIGLIGSYGHVQSMLDHIALIEFVAVPCMSEMGERTTHFASQVEKCTGAAPKIYDSWSEMCEGESLDGVIVCSDNVTKPGIVAECLQRGLHVLAEKPLALTHEEVDLVAKAHRESKATLSLMLSQRFRPDYAFLRERVQGGEIGRIASIFAANPHVYRSRKGLPERARGGLVVNTAIHIIDLVFWITGERPSAIMGAQSQRKLPVDVDLEDSAQLLMVMEDGGSALLDSTQLFPEQTVPSPPTSTGLFPFVITGTEGVLESGRKERFQGIVNLFRSRTEPQSWSFEITTYREVMKSFLENIRSGKEDPVLPAEEIFTVSRIALYASQAAREQRAVSIEWPAELRPSRVG